MKLENNPCNLCVPTAVKSIVRKASSLYFRLVGRKWTSHLSPLYPPYHVHGFSPDTLGNMLQKTGFRVLKLADTQFGMSGMKMYHPILRLGMQLTKWFSRELNSGEGLEAYITK